MPKFKAGDRVAVYDEEGRWVGHFERMAPTGAAVIKAEKNNSRYVHPKQCRLLVKKEKRRVRLRYDNDQVLSQIDNNTVLSLMRVETSVYSDGWIEFIEVKKK